MGLVATWLSGIGLSSAVPTFQAAGIVTPDALAELDVAHFEALGILDPDDRRKLFYLVQRIKLAVRSNKKKPRPRNNDEDEENGTVEEQVESLSSGTSVGGTGLKTVSVDSEDSQYQDSIQSMQGTEEDEEDIDETNESKEDHYRLLAHPDHFNDGKRRSQRLAAKQPIPPTSPRRSKENRLTQNQLASKSSKAPTPSPTLRTPSGTPSTIPGFNGAASPKSQVPFDWVDERMVEQPSYAKLSPRRANGRPGDSIDSNLSASDSFEAEEKASNGVSTVNVAMHKTSSALDSLSKPLVSKLVFPSASEQNESADSSTKSVPVSRMPAPRASRPQSRLPNPTSKTTRTGKQLPLCHRLFHSHQAELKLQFRRN
jgi:SAM domain (Sterile alpha motif)